MHPQRFCSTVVLHVRRDGAGPHARPPQWLLRLWVCLVHLCSLPTHLAARLLASVSIRPPNMAPQCSHDQYGRVQYIPDKYSSRVQSRAQPREMATAAVGLVTPKD